MKDHLRDDFWIAVHDRHDACGLGPDEKPFFNEWEFTNPGE
jgi:hypothetical protein